MDSKILEIFDLEKNYNSNFKLSINNLYLERNKILSIMGPNGSGKSNLIKLIGMLEKPDKGGIFFNGKNISNGKVDYLKTRKEMAIVFQEPAFFNTTVYNNIILGLKIRKINISSVKEWLDYLIQELKISKLLYRNIKNLSGGEKQRVSLVRSFILNSQLLILDEPLANIDQLSRESLRESLFEVIKTFGKSVIYVTHDRTEAMILADYIAVLNEGRVEQFGEKDEIFHEPANEFIARFAGVETLIYGVVDENRKNVCTVRIYKSDMKVFVTGNAQSGESVVLAIRPEAVILFNINIKPQQSSAMNLFEGKITEIKDIGIFKKIEIDCGFNLTAFVTQDSINRLGLAIERKIYAAIKASSIHMFKN